MANMILELHPVCFVRTIHQNDANPTHMHHLHNGLSLLVSFLRCGFLLPVFLVSLLKAVLDLEEASNHIPAVSSIFLFLMTGLLLKGTCFHSITENPLV